METIQIIDSKNHVGETVKIGAWVANKRSSGKIAFLQLRDGTAYFQGVVVKSEVPEEVFQLAKNLHQETSIILTGEIREDSRSKFGYEIGIKTIEVVSESHDYPITPKEHGTDFLMDHRHLWLRSSRQHAIMQIRNEIIRATYEFFNNHNFVKIDPPILTGSAPEGTTDLFETNYFDQKAYLSQSGQLYMEAAAMAFGKVFSFGPTFRAEKSKTRRHLIEFWMIEPEIAFADLEDDMDLIEDMVKYCIDYVLDNAPAEMEFFASMIDKDCINRITKVKNSDFKRMTYTEAIEILEKADVKFKNKVSWGMDLNSEHERYICEQVVKGPVFLTDYPKEIKAFYMRLNDDNKTVAACDLLVPGIGELVGGSQREERYDVLERIMDEKGMSKDGLQWYMDLRRYGGCKHAGFGLGFDRFLMYLTGMQNIRDVEPFPRTPRNLKF